MTYAVVSIHDAKSNKEGDHDDYRGLAHTRNVLKDPLILNALHCADRLFMGKGQPLPETLKDSEDWCVA
jgi:hypothetical protein